MITRVVLGNDTELTNIEEVREVVQDNGDYIYKGISINIKDTSVNEVLNRLSEENALQRIKVYKKDELERSVDEETGEVTYIYGEEYLCLESSDYTGLKSIYGNIDTGLVTISLGADHTKLADEKYNELINENANLKAQNESLSRAVAELTAIISTILVS